MKTSQTPVTPARQAMVRIAGHKVLSICTANGSIGAGFRMICDLLYVDHPTQIRKLQADSAFRDCFILAKVEIAGKQRVARFIIAEFIPLWLKGIHPSKVAPEARETLEEFRSVAVQTLRAFFSPETKAQQQSAPPKDEPTQSTLPPPEPEQFPPLGDEARYEYQDAMYHAHDGLERHLRSIDARLLTLTRQMADVRQVLNQHADALNEHADALNEHIDALLGHKEMLAQHRDQLRALRARPDGESGQANTLLEQVKRLEGQVSGLTAQVAHLEAARSLTLEHQVEVRTWMRALAYQTGQQTPALERELAAAFGVEAVSQLTEVVWDEVAAWFHQRLGW